MVSALLLPIGLAMLVIAAISRREEKQADLLRQWGFTQDGPLPGAPVPGATLNLSPRRKPRQVAHRGFSVRGRFNLNQPVLFVVQVFILLWVLLAVANATRWVPSHGFAVRTMRPGVKLKRTTGAMPIRIRVLAGNQAGYKRVPMRGVEIGS
jgi:hypothetical protein